MRNTLLSDSSDLHTPMGHGLSEATPVSSRTWQNASNLSWLSMTILSVSMHLHGARGASTPTHDPVVSAAPALPGHGCDACAAEALRGGPVNQARGGIQVAFAVSARVHPLLDHAELHLRQ